MVLKCIFDDEMIPVKAVDEDTSICFLSFDIPSFFYIFHLACFIYKETKIFKKNDFLLNYCGEFITITDRILHPFFGCTRRERFLKVSLYTSMDEISALCEHKNTSDFRQLAKIAVSVASS